MLKWYAETFKLTEKQMTAKALRQNWVLTGMSLFLIPAIFILEIGNLTGAALYAVRMAYYISFICLVCLTCTKFLNRFWSRDKYLDEWERGRKHQAMAFTLQALCYLLSVIGLIAFFGSYSSYGQGVYLPELDLKSVGAVLISTMAFCFFTTQIYLLVTTKPIDSFDELRNDLSLDDVI